MILQKYILRQLVSAFFTVFIILFAVVMLTGPLFKFHKEASVMGADFLINILPYFIPISLAHLIPLSLLVASIFVFGRFAEDNELTAIKNGGIHLTTVIWPVGLFGIILATLTMWLNTSLIPRCYAQTRELTVDAFKKTLISPDLVTRTIKLENYRIYYRDIKEKVLSDIAVVELDPSGRLKRHIKAEKGRLEFDEDRAELTLQLENVIEANWSVSKDRLTHQLIPKSSAMKVVLNLTRLMIPKRKNLAALTNREISKMIERNKTDIYRPWQLETEKYQRRALGLAPLIFLLIGMPLGIIIHKGSKVAGLGLSALIIFLGYYPLTLLGNFLGATNQVRPQLAVWLANLVLAVIGLALLARVFRQ